MTKEKQIIAIAELDGWTRCPRGDGKTACAYERDGRIKYSFELENYLTSRDAIIPVIEKQSYNIQESTLLNLNVDVFDGWSHHVVVRVMLATPSQLAEALLRVTNKWEE